MLKMIGSWILLAALSLGLQACAVQQLKINPGFGKKGPSALPSVKNGSYAERPVWKVGYWWEYSWRRPGASDSVTERVVREDEFKGHPSYVVQRGTDEYYYTKDVLGVVAKMSKGKLVYARDAPRQNFAWPLEPGKEWRNFYVKEDRVDKSTHILDYRMIVTGQEEVSVPAGTFKCFKVEVYTPYIGTLISEYWYSPQVKSYVKYRIYAGEGHREGELLDFKVQ